MISWLGGKYLEAGTESHFADSSSKNLEAEWPVYCDTNLSHQVTRKVLVNFMRSLYIHERMNISEQNHIHFDDTSSSKKLKQARLEGKLSPEQAAFSSLIWRLILQRFWCLLNTFLPEFLTFLKSAKNWGFWKKPNRWQYASSFNVISRYADLHA